MSIPPSPKPASYRPDIDGLRAVAVLAVIGFHAFPEWVKGGFVGVDIFFVISGFLITGIILRGLEAGHFRARVFYAHRIRRIFPALILVLVCCGIAGWRWLLPTDFATLGKHVAGGAGFISNLLLWGEAGYFDAAAADKPLLHLWSLGIEEQFYLLWPCLLYLAYRLGVRSAWPIGIIALLSFALNLGWIGGHPIGVFYSPLTRFWELAAGGILAQQATCHPQRLARLPRDYIALAGCGLILAAILLFDKSQAFPGWRALLPVVGACLVIAAGKDARPNRYLLASRLPVAIGLISYPLYLWHWPLLSFLHLMGQETMPMRGGAVAASFLLAVLTYWLIEKPLRFGGHAKRKIMFLCFAMAMVGTAGLAIFIDGGVPGRFPPPIQGIGSLQHYDTSTLYRKKTCFLEENNESVFGDCTRHPAGAPQESILLWGDSHAAHLYPGIAKTFGERDTITQFTAGGCPPIMSITIKERPNCTAINRFVLQWVAQHKPDRVILAAVWSNHDWKTVASTVTQLQALGIRHVDLVGEVPIWIGSLPKSLYLYYLRHHTIPDRMRERLSDPDGALDKDMRAYTTSLGVRYVSPWEILCTPDGCLTRLGDDPEELTAWDYGHLTRAGSEYLVAHFPPD